MVHLASSEWFSTGADEDVCDFKAYLSGTYTTAIDAYDFDFYTRDATLVKDTPWSMFQGTLEFDLSYIDAKAEPECLDLDPKLFATGIRSIS